MAKHFQLISTFLTLILLPYVGTAETRLPLESQYQDPRGAPDVTICNQNLENYGLPSVMKSRMLNMTDRELAAKERALGDRVAKAGCDILSVQEFLGSREEDIQEGAEHFVELLRRKTGRFFEYAIGDGEDKQSHVGFFYAVDKIELLAKVSYSKVELPRLLSQQRPRLFPRGPLEIQVRVKGNESKLITLVSLHWKSKRGGDRDPTGLEWETYRMEMSEALRRVLFTRHKDAFGSAERILVVLGDRNNNFDTASSKILEGTVALDDFKEKSGCRLNKRGVPLCAAGTQRPKVLFSVLTEDPQVSKVSGTFVYKKTFAWLDDILLPQPSLRYAWTQYDTPGDYESGVISVPREASDHALVYVRLNW